jgi:hypothetical protein
MDNQAYITSKPLTQPVSSPLTPDFIEQLARSPWSPDGVNSATVPPPDIIPSSDGDVASLACFEAAPVSPDVTGNAISRSKRGRAIIKKLMRPFFKLQKRHGAPRPKRASVKPFARKRAAARSRARRSRTAHGGARKAADDGGGPSPSPAPLRARQWIFLKPDGSVTLEEDGNLIAEFDNIGVAVRWLLKFEKWARNQDTWDGRSYRDKDHPFYPVIRWGMKWLDDPRSAGPAPRPKTWKAA